MRRRIALILAIFSMMSILVLTSYAQTDTKGSFNSDGSYQFGTQELKRLQDFQNTVKNQRSFVSYSDFLQYVAPEYYSQLEPEYKEIMSTTPWFSPESSSTASVPEAQYMTWDASIEKYGASLKGDAWITGRNDEFVIAQCFVHTPGNYENYVGYSTKTTKNPSYSTETRATVVIDPPSGTYMTTGVFTYPIYDELGNLTYSGVNAHSSHMSYVNPY